MKLKEYIKNRLDEMNKRGSRWVKVLFIGNWVFLIGRDIKVKKSL